MCYFTCVCGYCWRHKLGNTYEHSFVGHLLFYVPLHGSFVVCVSVRVCWCAVLSFDNSCCSSWWDCFIIIYCGVSFICLLLLGTLARDLIYSLCSFYVNIFLRAPHGGKFGLNIHIYIYIILARVVSL